MGAAGQYGNVARERGPGRQIAAADACRAECASAVLERHGADCHALRVRPSAVPVIWHRRSRRIRKEYRRRDGLARNAVVSMDRKRVVLASAQ